ncbi:hypothetical protein CCP2SC5_110019 [Azospirillaceae bacterium]
MCGRGLAKKTNQMTSLSVRRRKKNEETLCPLPICARVRASLSF